jgi:hypothetical protein
MIHPGDPVDAFCSRPALSGREGDTATEHRGYVWREGNTATKRRGYIWREGDTATERRGYI